MGAVNNQIRTHPCPACYLCGSLGKPLYQGLKDGLFGVPGTWNPKQCPNGNCSLVWLDPMPIEKDIEKLYATYLTHTPGSFFLSDSTTFREKLRKAFLASGFGYKNPSPQHWTTLLGHLGMRSRFFRERVGSAISWLDASWGRRLLDVGCGNGEFLAQMRDLGWDVTGVEPDPKAAQVGRETYGLTIYSGVLENINFLPESFDAVTMVHVIEHLPDPISTLKVARGLLKKGGHLVVHTPNISSLGHRWFRHNWRGLEPPRHLFIFNPDALRKIAETAGFNVLDVKNNSVSADFFWTESFACKEGAKFNTISDGYAKLSGCLFMLLEHLLTGWPFYRGLGEQLMLIAAKN